MSGRARRGADEGYILVAVLAVLVLLTGFVAAASVVTRSALHAARVADADVASEGLTLSGLEIAGYQLGVLKVAPGAVNGRRIRLTGGVVTPRVVDEGAKVDLNASDPKLLAGVLASVGMEEATVRAAVDRIVALRGPPNAVMPQSGGGAPDPSTPRKRRGLQSVEDLRAIEGVTAADMRLLRARFTVFNPDGKVNIVTADPDLLAAIPGMSKLRVAQILQARESGSREAVVAVQSTFGDLLGFTKATAGPAFDVKITAEETGGRKKTVEAVIAASKSPNEPYYILDWRD